MNGNILIFINNFRFLIVEDIITNQKIAINIIESLGYTVDAVDNGYKAVDMLKQIDYDIVFMDIHMPLINGIETTQIIRKSDSGVINPNVTIIAMTASVMKDDKELFLRSGMDNYLSKPFNKDDFKTIIDYYLKAKSDLNRSKNSSEDVKKANILNINELLDQYFNDENFCKGIIKSSIDYTISSIPKIKKYIEEKDFKNISFESHAIKGQMANIYAHDFFHSSQKLEKATKEKSDISYLEEIVSTMESDLQNLISFYEKW